jgi:predicted dehydrogenase
MVGGGQGSFIGEVHRKAIALDGYATCVAGCFSRNYENTLATGNTLEISKDRLYKDFNEMVQKEARRADPVDFVVIVTPNVQHYAITKAFLQEGIPVVCDKPFTITVEEAEELTALATQKGLLCAITYTYTGYPAVKQVREMLRHGDIGMIRFINAEYPQGWLAASAEKGGNKQAAWRMDPQLAGKSCCVGDIGSHIENMISYITGMKISRLCARLDSFGPGRTLDDNATIMVEYTGGAKGVYWSSQIAIGNDNGLRFRIFGTKGTIEWWQEDPDHITLSMLGEPTQTLSRGRDTFYPAAQAYSRIPAGHPEGYIEAFANVYKAYIQALSKQKAKQALTESDLDFPSFQMGIDGVRFIDACVESSRKGVVWVQL